jgi:hypothetical protein
MRVTVLLPLFVFCGACAKQPETSSVQSTPAASPTPAVSVGGTEAADSPQRPAAFLSKAAGVYKRQFENALVNGGNYQSEDILEVVPVDDRSAYVRMDLEFSNGHSGSISGIATVRNNSLIYDNGESGDAHCVVEYLWTEEKVVTRADYDKTPGCSTYHGARGTLDGAEFPVNKRQDIRYMQRLKDSREFKEAMERYRKAER